MIFVASYCRVSTDKNDPTNSFEAQQRYFYVGFTPGFYKKANNGKLAGREVDDSFCKTVLDTITMWRFD